MPYSLMESLPKLRLLLRVTLKTSAENSSRLFSVNLKAFSKRMSRLKK
jgi:hypothetical protein